MINRDAQHQLIKLAASFKAISIIGPRQSGKTTLSKLCFPNKKYVSLENISNRLFAEDDPAGFLSTYSDGAIIDEIQRVPSLFSYLQEELDNTRETGKYILTGSNNFLLHEKISQSLAGRVAIIKLLPLSYTELANKNLYKSLDDFLFKGSYPPIYDQPVKAHDWLQNYITTYIEKDVRQVSNIGDLGLFTKFVKILASHTSQELNLTTLGNSIGINHKTAQSWISILEAGFIIHKLPPHFTNFNKVLVKRPKIYFYDTGLVCSLIGIHDETQLANHPLRGAIFETMIVSELLKQPFNKGEISNLYYWRDKTGKEIDIIIDNAGKLIPLEIKSSQTIATDFFKNIKYYQNLNKGAKSYLLYNGTESQKRSDGTEVMNWENYLSTS